MEKKKKQSTEIRQALIWNSFLWVFSLFWAESDLKKKKRIKDLILFPPTEVRGLADLKQTCSHLSDDISDVLLVLRSEVRSYLHQDRRFAFSLQGIALLQHLRRLYENVNTSVLGMRPKDAVLHWNFWTKNWSEWARQQKYRAVV